MKTFRFSSLLIPTLLVALTACGSSTTSSAGGTDVPTSDSVEVPVGDTAPISEPVTTPTPTAPPATTPPATTPPATTPPTTAPSATTPPVKNPPAPSLPTPTFNSFAVSEAEPCAEGEPAEQVTVSWDVSGATSVYVAIDNEFGPYEQDLPASGSLDVPGPGCGDDQTYFVVAENSYGRTVEQITLQGG